MKISVVIPVFNGDETLYELYRRIKLTFDGLFDYEVLFIHDGGSIEAWAEIVRIKNQFRSGIKAIKLTRNYGQHNAIKCGIEQSEGDLIVTMDEDLQHAPEDILKLIDSKEKTGSDLVYGSYIRRKHSPVRNISSICLNLLLINSIPGLSKDYSSFRLMDSKIAKQTLSINLSYSFLDGDLAMITDKINSVPVYHFKSARGKSSYSLFKLFWHSLSIFAGYSRRLHRAFKVISIVLITISIVAFLLIILNIQNQNWKINGMIENLAVVFLLTGLLFLGFWILSISIEKYNVSGQRNVKYEIMEIL